MLEQNSDNLGWKRASMLFRHGRRLCNGKYFEATLYRYLERDSIYGLQNKTFTKPEGNTNVPELHGRSLLLYSLILLSPIFLSTKQ